MVDTFIFFAFYFQQVFMCFKTNKVKNSKWFILICSKVWNGWGKSYLTDSW